MTATPAFRPLPGVFEPSGVQQLADGRFLVVEDEKEFPFALFRLDADGNPAGPPLPLAAPAKLNDLEGLTRGPSGRVYAVTSHSRDGDGETKKSRRRLVRFRVDGTTIVEPAVCETLLPALEAAHPALAAAARVDDVKAAGGLNVEALEMSPDGRELLVGLRGPLLDGLAVAAAIAEPDAPFDAGTPPRLSIRRVDLGGQGFRALAWVPALAGYLAVSGPAARTGADFGLWLWDGRAATARRMTIPGLESLARCEGICAATLGDRSALLLVRDDGDRAAGRPAGVLLIDPLTLRPAA